MNGERKSLNEAKCESAELRKGLRELAEAVADRNVGTELERSCGLAPLLIVVAGSNGSFQRVNTAFEGLLGWSERELLSRRFTGFVHPDDQEAAASRLAKLARGDAVDDFENRLVCKDGSYRRIFWAMLPLADQGLICGIGQDIARRERTLQELRRERNRSREYLDIAGVVLVVLDVNGRVVLLNRRGHEILGHPEGALLGLDWFETCIPQKDRDRMRAGFRQLISGNLDPDEYFENPILTRSGNERIIAWHNALLFDESGERTGTLSSGEDITERRQAEQALRNARDELERRVVERTHELDGTNRRLNEEIEERRRTEAALRQSHAELKAIYDSVADGVLIAEVETKRFVRSNAAICEMLGYTEEELSSMSVMDIHRPEELASVLEKFEMLAARQIRLAENVAVRCKDGSLLFADITACEANYRERPCMIGFFRDMTSRRREEALRQRLQQEIIRVGEQERWRLGAELHDGLCQHLVAAVLTWRVVENQLAVGRLPDRAEVELLRTVLEKSRNTAYDVARGLCPTSLRPESLSTALQQLARQTNETSGLTCEFNEHGDTQIHDEHKTLHLYRIAQEAVSNTLKHARARHILLRLLGEENTIVFQIQDDGSAGNRNAAQGGSLGLHIMTYRAEIMGGSVTVEHPPAGGTVVTCRVPRR